MRISDFNVRFIRAMVGAMYAYEVAQVGNPDLLTDAEIADFYAAYCGYCAM